MYDVKFLRGEYPDYVNIATKDSKTFYFCTDTNQLFLGEVELDSKDVDFKVEATAASDGKVNVITGFEVVDGKIKAGSVAEQLLAKVAVSGAAADVVVTDAGNKLDAANVEDALAELAGKLEDAGVAADVSVEEGGASGDVLKSYTFYQGVKATDDAATKESKKLITINIPKDYLVRSAEVKTVTTADDPYTGAKVGDKYIDFTVNTKDGEGTGTASHLYVAINDLIHPISGSTGAEVTITVSATNEIGATINSIDGSKIVYKAETSEGAGDGESVKAALTRLDGANTVEGSVSKKVKDAIDSLSADVDAVTDTSVTDAEKVAVVTGVTEANGVITGVDSIDVDKAGAASRAKSAVIGEDSDAKTANTIKGVKNFIGTLPTDAESDTIVGYIDEKTGEGVNALNVDEFSLISEASDVLTIHGIKEVSGKIAVGTDVTKNTVLAKVAKTGAAADVSVATNEVSATNVEAAIVELAAALTWGSF